MTTQPRPARDSAVRPNSPARASAAHDTRGAQYDGVVVLLVGALMTLGVTMVYSATVTTRGGAEFELRQWWNSPLRQCVFAVGGFLALVFAAHLDYRWFSWESRGGAWRCGALAVLAGLLLVAVLIPGVGSERLGAQRTIVVLRGPISLGFQPSEVAKLVMPVWLAAMLTRPGGDPRRFRGSFVPAVATGGVMIGLTGIEDFGTAALMGVILLCMLVLAGARFSHLALLGVLGLAAGVALIAVEPYRMDRIRSFLEAKSDAGAESYQVAQSLLAIGSGGWFGRGLGAGVRKYGYLPQDNNDFILAIICEELGVVGGMCVVALFLLLLLRGWWIAVRCPDAFGRLLATGITLTICLQAAFNIGVVTNSIPTKGISLPFVSAGGSGVLFLGLAAGLLASVGRWAGVPRTGASSPKA